LDCSDCSGNFWDFSRKALLEEAANIITTTGGRLALDNARALCTYYCNLTYQKRVNARADIATACEALGGLMAQLAGFVVGWTEGSQLRSTTVAAKSIQRLKTSHQHSWSIGVAPGKSSWKAFRSHGTVAIIPQDVALPVLADAAATTAISGSSGQLARRTPCKLHLAGTCHAGASCHPNSRA